MEEFYIGFEDSGWIKVLFEVEQIDNELHYSGVCHEGEHRPVESLETNLICSFAFRRKPGNWNSVSDFHFESRYPEYTELKKDFERFLIMGIQGYDTQEPFEYQPY